MISDDSVAFPRSVIAVRDLPYDDLGLPLAGLLCWDEAQDGPRPGILLIHGGAGLDGHARDQARRYAALGYAVLACDMFGPEVAGNRERVMACLLALRDDQALLVRRARAGLTALAGCPQAGGRMAAVGFCFGGMAALALARAGTDLAGPDLASAVSIHGSLATSRPAEPGTVTARILVCHGAADPHVPLSDVTAFAEEMNRAGADWELVMYGRAMHGFTHQQAVSGAPGALPGVAYDKLADERSFAATRTFLADTLAS
ncbi:MAG TPA: dienelactone hydrolase family protein [Streptosporangiaceae bacterium]|nr:dienelactone hydrolase family protein [Streptosporangiaceae bacterium]